MEITNIDSTFKKVSGPKSRVKIESIQILRGFAAFIVIVHHLAWAIDSFGTSVGFIQRSGLGKLGACGVDIFFVISGFIMFYTQNNSRSENRFKYALGFLKRRVIRIYPLYWIWTVVLLGLWYLKLALTSHKITVLYVIASFFLIPYPQPDGNIHPFLDQGWTLSFELYFYLVFSIGLIGSYNHLKIGAIVVCSLIVIGLISYLTNAPSPVRYITDNSLIVEFVFGGAIVYLIEYINPKFYKFGSFIFALGALLMIATLFGSNQVNNRALVYGVPAFLLVFGIVLREKRKPFKQSSVNKFAFFLGDASYSIYLTHVFFVMALGTILKKGHLNTIPADALIIAGSIIVTLLCSISYILIERPLVKLLAKKK